MSAAIVATVGDASANSYVTLAEADTYMGERVGSTAWDESGPDARNRALISAARRIDQEEFAGQKYTETQAMAWPRSGAEAEGYAIDVDVIPPGIKHAQIELALVLAGSTALLVESDLHQFKRVKAGPLEADLRDTPKAAGTLPSHVVRFLRPFLRSSAGSIRLVCT